MSALYPLPSSPLQGEATPFAGVRAVRIVTTTPTRTSPPCKGEAGRGSSPAGIEDRT